MMVAAKKRAIERLRETDPNLDEYDTASKFLAFASDQVSFYFLHISIFIWKCLTVHPYLNRPVH